MKSAKTLKALILSAVSMMICIAMLLGTTFAYFSKTAVTGTNIVKTSGYDVVLKWTTNFSSDVDNWDDLEDADVLFAEADNVLMPGESTGIVYIAVKNNNSYAVNATVSIGAPTVTGADASPLKICYKVTDAAVTAFAESEKELFAGAVEVLTGENIALAAGQSKIVAIAFELPSTHASEESVKTSFVITVAGDQQH